jgi:phage gpG-like protein
MSVEFESEQWTSYFKRIQAKWSDIDKRKKYAAMASGVAFADIIDHFNKSQGPKGKWQQWSSLYREHMEKIGKGGNKILIDSGRLRGSLAGGGSQKYKTNTYGILLSTKVKYAAAHQYGYKKKNIPARPFMWLSKTGMKRLIMVTERWLAEK